MTQSTCFLIAILALGSATAVAQETDEATNEGSPLEIECEGNLSTFARRVLRAVRQHELAVPTRPAIREAFNQLDVNADGTIDSCESAHLAEDCDQLQGIIGNNTAILEIVVGQQEYLEGDSESQMFQCKGYLE